MSKKSTPEEVQHSAQYPPVVDVCCGSRSFWFDKKDPRALFLDIRRETHEAKDTTRAKGFQEIVIDPDIQCDFTNLPLPDDSFALVVFDPPHLRYNGASGLTHKKYGTLPENWRSQERDLKLEVKIAKFEPELDGALRLELEAESRGPIN
jgi:hypothetical protein